MTQTILNVWLHGVHIGEIERLRSGRVRLRFAGSARARWGDGTRILSYSLPLSSKRIEGPVLDDYLENLLPEGPVRTQLERHYGVRPADAFGLLTHIGYECAGAVQFTASDAPAVGHVQPLTRTEASAIVDALPTLTPPEGESVTASLGGIQSKVLLTRMSQGWAWPAAGAMSTHIIKPEPTEVAAPIPRIVEYENWALALARSAGVRAAKSSLERFGTRLAIVVERYDRADGVRLHQENFAQALGIRPGAKYEPPGAGPGRLARVALGPGTESLNPENFRRDLLRLVVFNAIIGNGDAHAKNYSLMLTDGIFSVAPAYDVAPVFFVDPRYGDFRMNVAGQRSLRTIRSEHLVREAASWGMREAAAKDVVTEVAAGVRSGLQVLDTPDFIQEIAEKLEASARRLAG